MFFIWKRIIILLLVIVPKYIFSQSDFMKYGKIDEQELKMECYPGDTSANAVVLGDNGSVYFQINRKGDKWEMLYERHVKIKIFNKKAFDFANVIISLYRDKGMEERVTLLRGATYYLENGKVMKGTLGNENVFREDINEKKIHKKFAMPSIREGCIIEYEYTVASEFIFTLSNWRFQYSIPVVRSEFNARIPEYFKYNLSMKGYLSLSDKTTENRDDVFTIPYQTLPQQGGLVERGTYTLKSHSVVYRWIMKDIPAFRMEPFMNNKQNYVSALDFELASYTFPGESFRSYTDTWESINKQLLEDDNFGGQLKRSGFMTDDLNKLKNSQGEDKNRLLSIYAYIQGKIKWNGTFSMYTSQPLKKIFTLRSGNSADINLMLILALRESGFDVSPIVLSTRDNGIIMPSHPNISQLNHVFACVKINGTKILLDATDALVPMGMLPEACLNGMGYMVTEGKSQMISLDSIGTHSVTVSSTFSLDDYGNLKGMISKKYKDYAAIEFRKHVSEDVTQKMLIEEIQKKYPDYEISDFSLTDADSIYKPIQQNYSFEETNKSAKTILYINPFGFGLRFENVFKEEERKYPVDFIYARQETYMFKINVPDGFEIIEKPENIIMTMPDRSAKVVYSVTQIENLLQVIYSFSITRKTFLPSEYNDLKALFMEIVKKQQENIVIRKKA